MGKAFSSEFRNKIVQFHLDHGKPIKSLAEEYSVSVSSVSRWVIYHRNKSLSEAEKLSKDIPFDNPPHDKRCANGDSNKVL